MDATIAKVNKQLDNVLRPLFENKTFMAVLALFFALYAGFLAPALPNGVIRFFDTIVGKLLFIFLIAFVASRNLENSFQIALIVSVIFLITLTVLNNLKMKEAFQSMGVEHFSLMNQMRNIVEHMENKSDETDKEQKPEEPNKADVDMCKTIFTEDKCMSTYNLKPANEENCGAIFTKEKCMSAYDIKPANEETCDSFVTVDNCMKKFVQEKQNKEERNL